MNLIKRVLCIILSGAMVLVVSSCNNDKTSSEYEGADSTKDTVSHREEYIEKEEVAFVDKDGEFEFKTDKKGRLTAKLQAYGIDPTTNKSKIF